MSSTLVVTPVDAIPPVVEACRLLHESGAMLSIAQRRTYLRAFISMLDENRGAFVEATHQDLRKCEGETVLTEVMFARNEAIAMLNHLDEWAAPQRVVGKGVMMIENLSVRHEPLGVVLIIGAWNYPFQLTLVGAIGAIAAGNTVVIKPSEVAPCSAQLLATLIPKYFPPAAVAVVNGSVPQATALLAQRFDHIMYTGGATVAKIVMAAAAKNLTPVTLELGGKSPCVIDDTCDIPVVAQRVMWGRIVNAGQTCIAPDYVLVHRSKKDALIRELGAARTRMLGEDPSKSPDYSRIVNDAHYQRVERLLDGGKIVVGGERDPETRYIAPTVLDDVKLDSPLMQDEIFGPLLPLIPFDESSEVLSFINRRDKPLALYVFSTSKTFVDRIIDRTSSGAVVVNDVLMHAACDVLPFGGIGQSGMGAYHGLHTFETFSHKKPIMRRRAGLEFVNAMRYPPNTARKLRLLEKVLSDSPRGWFGRVLSKVVRATFVLVVPIGAYSVVSRI